MKYKHFLIINLIAAMLTVVSCSNSGGGGSGVVDTQERPENPVTPNPPINDEDTPPDNPDLYYTNQEFQQLINDTEENGTLLLDRDVYMDEFSVMLSKSITIKSDDVSDKKMIYVSNTSGVFEVFANNIRIESLKFSLKNTDTFINSAVDNDFLPLHTGIFIQDLEILLKEESEMQINMSQPLFYNNTIIGLDYTKTQQKFNARMVKFLNASNLDIKGNVLVDLSGKYTSLLSMENGDNAQILDNLFYGDLEDTNTLVTILGLKENRVDGVSIYNNYFFDENNGNDRYIFIAAVTNRDDDCLAGLPDDTPEDQINVLCPEISVAPEREIVGANAIGFSYVDNLNDNSIGNMYGTQNAYVELNPFHGPNNTFTLSQVSSVEPFINPSSIFTDINNNDYSLKCDVINNILLTESVNINLKSINYNESSIFYYGAIAPSCN